MANLQWVSLHVSAGAWQGTHEHSSEFLGPLPSPAGRHVHSTFIELQADRQPENISRPPSPPSSLPPSSQHIFSQSFPLASPVVLGSCQTPATLWEAGPPIPKPNKWEKENRKKKKKVQAHVDMHKTLSPSETLEPSPAPLANCRRRSADLALLAPAEESYCPSFLLPPTDTYVHPPRV